jgi:hypothetical protein
MRWKDTLRPPKPNAWSSPIEGSDKRRFFAVLQQPPGHIASRCGASSDLWRSRGPSELEFLALVHLFISKHLLIDGKVITRVLTDLVRAGSLGGDEMTEPDIIQEGIRQAMRRETVLNLRWLISIVELSCISTPILLALILWRIW